MNTTIKRGDFVVMTDKYAEHELHMGQVFCCSSDPWVLGSGETVIRLAGFGTFAADGLRKATANEILKSRISKELAGDPA